MSMHIRVRHHNEAMVFTEKSLKFIYARATAQLCSESQGVFCDSWPILHI